MNSRSGTERKPCKEKRKTGCRPQQWRRSKRKGLKSRNEMVRVSLEDKLPEIDMEALPLRPAPYEKKNKWTTVGYGPTQLLIETIVKALRGREKKIMAEGRRGR